LKLLFLNTGGSYIDPNEQRFAAGGAVASGQFSTDQQQQQQPSNNDKQYGEEFSANMFRVSIAICFVRQ